MEGLLSPMRTKVRRMSRGFFHSAWRDRKKAAEVPAGSLCEPEAH